MLARKLKLSFIPLDNELGLFLVRVLIGLNLFIKHGWQKIASFSDVTSRVPDVLHIGVVPTIALAAVGDVGCAILLMIGLATRWACLYSFVIISVAWIAREHFNYLGGNGDHGELMILYLSALLAIFVTGPGRYSLDALIKD